MRPPIICMMLIACTSATTNDTNPSCTNSMGLVEGEVVLVFSWDDADPSPAAYATVQATNDDEERLTIATDDQGQFSVSLPVGTWRMSATNAQEDCFTADDNILTVDECEVEQTTLQITECFG